MIRRNLSRAAKNLNSPLLTLALQSANVRREGEAVSLTIRPITRNAALPWIAEHHRHLRRAVTGWLFGIQLLDGNGERGVAVCGRPAARMLQDGLTCEITRISTNGHRNACSRAYGALRKAAVALGYTRIVTYTRLDEPGTSPLAAGFKDDGPAGGGEADRPSRRRGPVEDNEPKRRWIWEVKP